MSTRKFIFDGPGAEARADGFARGIDMVNDSYFGYVETVSDGERFMVIVDDGDADSGEIEEVILSAVGAKHYAGAAAAQPPSPKEALADALLAEFTAEEWQGSAILERLSALASELGLWEEPG